MYKIVIADDESMILEGLRKIITRDPHGFEIVGMAEDGFEAEKLLDTVKPDVFLTDISMPGPDGLELIRRAREMNPDLICVILSGYDYFEYAKRALQYGALDYLLKPVSSAQIYPLLDRLARELETLHRRLERDHQISFYQGQLPAGDESWTSRNTTDWASCFLDAVRSRDPGQAVSAARQLSSMFASELLPPEKVVAAVKSILNEMHLSARAENLFPATALFPDPTDALRSCRTITETGLQMERMIIFLQDQLSPTHAQKSDTVSAMKRYIRKHYAENITLSEIASTLYMSPKYLSDLFRLECGVSFMDYLTRVRVEKAKQLLQDPRYKVYEVGEMVGYQTPAYFNTVFKRETGLTPKQFQNQPEKE